MTEFTYLTIKDATAALYKEKGSRFLSFAFPVQNENEIHQNLDALRKKYFDARHHCYAWVLGNNKSNYRANDDGEPNHSAGDPILRQIRSKDLTNILVVVVRYFGGVKLGVGGLINAYKIASKEALELATIIQKELTKKMVLEYNYENTPHIMRLIKEFDMEVVAQKFEGVCNLEIQFKVKAEESIIQKLRLLNATGTPIRIISKDN